jgi:transcription elongation factor/antiterminator RfaH
MNWYAIYTNPRAEKKAYAELVRQDIEAYLPLQKVLKKWSDRKKWVEEPLFRSYIFVYIPQSQYLDVLNTPGVVRYVTFEGKAVPIPPRQIDAIRYFLNETSPEVTHDESTFVTGQQVEIVRGPLNGLTGQLVDFKGRQKVRIKIDALGQFLHLTVSLQDLKLCK